MEFIEEESRPRFLFHSRPSLSYSITESQPISKPLIFISISFSLLLLAFSLFFLHSHLLQFLLLWLSFSLILGPFAPQSVTGGDIGVGRGRIVEFEGQFEADPVDESKKKGLNRRQKGKRLNELGFGSNGYGKFEKKIESFDGGRREFESDYADESKKKGLNRREKGERLDELGFGSNGFGDFEKKIESFDGVEEREWSDEDLELLSKQILKHPVGKPKRWEVISEAFKGRHSKESVINKAKSMGKAKPVDSDSYSRFLKDRKPVDKRVESGNEGVVVDGGVAAGSGAGSGEEAAGSWSSGEDIALLNALKAFPKDVALRWEKIAAAVPGKSKVACMKRVADLKREFRSSKAGVDC